MFVLLADVVLLAEVDEVDDGLGGQKLKRVYNFDLCKDFWISLRCPKLYLFE